MFGIMLFTVHVPGLVSFNALMLLHVLDVQTRNLNEKFAIVLS